MEQPEPLVVRRHARLRCDLPARLAVAEASAAQVSPAAAATDAGGGIGVTVIDASRGGIGLRSAVFLPKMCQVTATLQVPAGAWGRAFEFRAVARVQRVTMLDRTPTYYLGTAFLAGGPGEAERVERLLVALEALQPAAADGAERA